MKRAHQGALLFTYLAIAASLYGVERLAPGSRAPGYLLVHFALTLVCVLVWWLGRRRPLSWHHDVLWVAVVARLLLFGVSPFTSHDFTRYLWDGKIAAQGLDPYEISPERFVKQVGPEDAPLPDNPQLATLYPPLAVAVFSFCARFGFSSGFWVWKIFVTTASLVLVLGSFFALKQRGKLKHFALAALLPLPLLEASVGVHVDILVAAFLLLGILTWPLPFLCGAALALATLTKLYPVLLIPPLSLVIVRSKGIKAALSFLSGAVLVLLTGYGLATLRDWSAVGSLFLFLREWQFGSPLYAALAATVGPYPGRVILLAIGGLGYLYLLAKAARGESAIAVSRKTLVLLWMTSPVVFPWYLVGLAVLLPFVPVVFLCTWLTLHPLTYEVIDRFDLTRTWAPQIWPLAFIAIAWVLTYRVRQLPWGSSPGK